MREYELVEFEKDMNAFLYEFIEIVKFYKETQDKAHKSGALQKSPIIKEIIAKYHSRGYKQWNMQAIDDFIAKN